MSSYADRLKALREQLKAEKLDGFVVPLTDEHMSEYVGSYAQRLAWLPGFQGSAGPGVAPAGQTGALLGGGHYLPAFGPGRAAQTGPPSGPRKGPTAKASGKFVHET